MTIHQSPRKKHRQAEADYLDSDRHASRVRCLALTGRGGTDTARTLTALTGGAGVVEPHDAWAPRGREHPEEPRIDEMTGLIKDPEVRILLHDWWVEPGSGSRTPPWDLAAACTVDGQPDLLLVEAMAHIGELNSQHMPPREKRNLRQIQKALGEASDGWNLMLQTYAEARGFKLSHTVKLSTDAHYPLGTRFAFAWKLATLGVPVILVYLGFLNARELEEDGRVIFRSPDMWRRCVFEKTGKPLPEEIWDETFHVEGTPLTVLRRSLHLDPDPGEAIR